ncbi:hypothetical protein TEA_010128 [Camellia sinensis var. sinensis]|uniref:Nucleotidyl transferase domain-containing protein n=1 Tax=Camellia sinensis var. sinensis TaxID=542762 RepID=A0A4V3WLI5_CAMSN|nr:hypothetical protein TEA_010128 [Camellia sinensis var. sinensis]
MTSPQRTSPTQLATATPPTTTTARKSPPPHPHRKVMLQYYIERQCLLKCTRQIIMHTWKSIMQLDNPVVPIGGIETILVIKVSAESANQFGELVADPVTNELLHYTEKPETFVSDRINCGVYIFTPDFFNAIQGVSIQRKDRGQ